MNFSRYFSHYLSVLIIFLQAGWTFPVGAQNIQRKQYSDQIRKYHERIDQQVSQLPELTKCDRLRDNAMINCVRNRLTSLSDIEIKDIEKVLELKTHNLIKSTHKREIVGFLATELEKKINGKTASSGSNRKKKKFLDQLDYIRLHKNRLAKATLLELSNFCRQRVHIPVNCLSTSASPSPSCSVKATSNDPSAIYLKSRNNHEDVSTLSELSGANIGQQKYRVCMLHLNELCKVAGGDACLFRDRIAKYQQVIKDSSLIEKSLTEGQPGMGYSVTSAYQGQLDPEMIDELSNITSDLVDHKEFRKLQASQDQVMQDCQLGQASKNCHDHLNIVNDKELDNIEQQIEKKYALQSVYFENLNPEDQAQFAKRYLNDQDIQDNIANLQAKINAEFKKRKQAIITNIRAQIANRRSDKIQEQENEKDFAITQASELDKLAKQQDEAHRNALRDNIFYSNLVNSYLSRANSNNPSVTSLNTAFGDAEFSKTAKDDGSRYFHYRENARQTFEQTKQQQGRKPASQKKLKGSIEGISAIINLILFGPSNSSP